MVLISKDHLIYLGNQSSVDNTTESLTEFNDRYAAALLPLTVVFGLLGLVGFCGNIIVIIIYGFGKKFKDKKYRCYVLCLAIIDFTTCLTLIPAEIIKHRSYFNFVETELCKVKCFFNVFAASAASVCLLIVAVDRYILTCHPLLCVKIRSFSHGVAWRLCILNFFFGIIISIPAAMMCGTSRKPMDNANGGITFVYLCESEPYYEHMKVRYAYRFTLVATQALLSIIVIILYVRIGFTIMRVMKNRRYPSDPTVNELRRNSVGDVYELRRCSGGNVYELRRCSTGKTNNSCVHPNHHPLLPANIKILFIVTVVFVVTYFGYIGMTWIDQTKLTASQFPVFALFLRIYFIHSIINPFLYAKMDSLFRERCKQLLKCNR